MKKWWLTTPTPWLTTPTLIPARSFNPPNIFILCTISILLSSFSTPHQIFSIEGLDIKVVSDKILGLRAHLASRPVFRIRVSGHSGFGFPDLPVQYSGFGRSGFPDPVCLVNRIQVCPVNWIRSIRLTGSGRPGFRFRSVRFRWVG